MGLEEKIPSGFVLTSVEKLAGYMRKNSLWPATFGLACCAIEMMAASASNYDFDRFGVMPEQTQNLIIVHQLRLDIDKYDIEKTIK